MPDHTNRKDKDKNKKVAHGVVLSAAIVASQNPFASPVIAANSHGENISSSRSGHIQRARKRLGWVMYVQPDKAIAEGTRSEFNQLGVSKNLESQLVTGKLVLVGPSGEHEIFHFQSGPWRKGALPGLASDTALAKPASDILEPHTVYIIGKPDYDRSNHDYDTTDGKIGIFIPLYNSHVYGRAGFGIHYAHMGTKGCIGILEDKASRRFNAIWRELERTGNAPTTLEVYTPKQNPDLIIKARHLSLQTGKPVRAIIKGELGTIFSEPKSWAKRQYNKQKPERSPS